MVTSFTTHLEHHEFVPCQLRSVRSLCEKCSGKFLEGRVREAGPGRRFPFVYKDGENVLTCPSSAIHGRFSSRPSSPSIFGPSRNARSVTDKLKGWVYLGRSGSRSVIQYHSDHCASKRSINSTLDKNSSIPLMEGKALQEQKRRHRLLSSQSLVNQTRAKHR